MTRLLYVYEERIPEGLRDVIRANIPPKEFEVREITYTANAEDWRNALGWAEVVLFAPGRFISDDILSHAKHIKLMQLWSSGYDKFNIAGAKKLGIPVANNGGANACSVAEHALLLMLAVYKWLPDSHRRAITGTWTGNSHGLDMFLLYGKRVGILGFGNIGKYVAKKLSGFETETVYFDIKRASTETEKDLYATYMPFDEVVRTSDILTLHLHSNEETRGIISREVINKMKPGAVLINVSRAQLVDQEALYDALASGHLSGAGLDVYTKEPTDGTEPLLKLKNVVATPHMAGSTYDTYAMVMQRAVENFRRAMRGKRPRWIVND